MPSSFFVFEQVHPQQIKHCGRKLIQVMDDAGLFFGQKPSDGGRLDADAVHFSPIRMTGPNRIFGFVRVVGFAIREYQEQLALFFKRAQLLQDPPDSFGQRRSAVAGDLESRMDSLLVGKDGRNGCPAHWLPSILRAWPIGERGHGDANT